MPRIERYAFGEVVIDGKTYREDVLILPDRVIPSWWRKEGHSLDPADLAEVLPLKPQTLIIGCGAFGTLKVPQTTRDFLQKQDITLIDQPTPQAIATYNASRSGIVACGLHLTC